MIEIITIIVLLGLFYWLIKIPYMIIRFLYKLLLVITSKVRIIWVRYE